MPETRIDSAVSSTDQHKDFAIPAKSTDAASEAKETRWNNNEWAKWFGFYKSIPELAAAIDAKATWTVGKGFVGGIFEEVVLNHIRGWGKDTFNTILENMIRTYNIGGDAFAEVIQNSIGIMINLKPLDPSSMTTFLNPQGIIIRYEQRTKTGENTAVKTFQPEQILHLVNDRVADSARGVSVIEAVEWNLQAQEEAKRAHRKMVKRNGIVRVIEVDVDDTTKLNDFKVQWKEAIDKGDVLILPKDVAEAKDWHGTLDTQGIVMWLNYLDDEFFMIIGIPKLIMGGMSEREGDSKMSYLSFEQVYKREANELIDDLWNQLAIKITLNKPASLQNQLADNELKNTSQVGFQPNDTTAGVGE
ncbi:hypothetical protein LCGC14_2121690 [marine sediment metagenome]|uniref:Phage portal protein n=1 Tax=marine sediment metagenome TaxID=412755 RepID=A0A0F9H0E5_9ZZZZ